MMEKIITITIDEQGRSTLDLEGFACKGCEQVFDAFLDRDLPKAQRKKLEDYSRPQVEREKDQR